ncbi:hypothetical protein [Methylomonas koyamae]|uniref:hypothetical protein n=1 Tax=Methylomonas koyamae TaxID=702114 RepID=UPI001E421568|nr:hypothetical protein [Methylomonas koyamae]
MIELLGQMMLKSHGLFIMKSLEFAVFVVGFKATDCFCNRIDRAFILPLGFLQKRKVLALDPLVVGIVFGHGFISLIEVTVYEGFVTLAYVFQWFRLRDVQVRLNFIQTGESDKLVDNAAATWAKTNQSPRVGICRFIISHVPGWSLRYPAANAIHFKGLTLALSAGPFALPVTAKIGTGNQDGPLLVNRRQPVFDPEPHGIFVYRIQKSDFLYRVISVDFGAIGILEFGHLTGSIFNGAWLM